MHTDLILDPSLTQYTSPLAPCLSCLGAQIFQLVGQMLRCLGHDNNSGGLQGAAFSGFSYDKLSVKVFLQKQHSASLHILKQLTGTENKSVLSSLLPSFHLAILIKCLLYVGAKTSIIFLNTAAHFS